VIALPSQLWRELEWWTIAVTMVTAYALFALAEVGLEIENVSLSLEDSLSPCSLRITWVIHLLTLGKPWGEGPNDLDLDRYCNLLALDLDEIMSHPQNHESLLKETGLKTSASSRTLSSALNLNTQSEEHVIDHFSDSEDLLPNLQVV